MTSYCFFLVSICICLTGFLQAAWLHAASQLPPASRLCGTVVSPQGSGIPGATVILEPSDLIVATDPTGSFCFDSLEHATYRLAVLASGYEEQSLNGIQLSSSRLDLTVEMTPPSRRDHIAVTASETGRRLADGPIRTELISAERIRERGAVNLAEALDVVTGIKVESGCTNCNFTSLRINGLDGAYSQVLIDGMPAFSSLDAIYGLEQLPTIVVDRIEIIKGGGSALFGSGAVGGVVNVITRRPAEDSSAVETAVTSLGGQAGTTTRGYGSFVGNQGKTSLFTFGTYDRQPSYDRDGDGESETARRSLQSGGLRFYQSLFDNAAELQFGFDMTREHRRGGSNLDLAPHQTSVAEEILSRRSTLTAQWSHFLGSSTLYRLQLAHVRSTHDSYYGVDFDPLAYGTTRNPLTSLAASMSHGLGPHTLTAGLQFDSDRIADARPGYGRLIEQTSNNTGLFLQDEWKFSGQLSLLGGVRFDRHNQASRSIASPRVTLLYSPSETLQVRATMAKGFRPPRVYDEDLHNEVAGGKPGFVINAVDLREERVTTASLSSNFIVTQGEWGGFRLEANLFHNRLRDTFILSQVDDPEGGDDRVLFRRSNGAGSRIFGLELNSDLQIREVFDVEIGWALQRGRLDQPEPEFNRTDFYRFPGSYGYLTTKYVAPLLTVSATVSRTGSMWLKHYAGYIDEDRVERTPSYTVMDAAVEVPLGWGEPPARIVAAVFNLFDTFQEDYDRGPLKHSGYVYGPRRPRTISLGIRFDF